MSRPPKRRVDRAVVAVATATAGLAFDRAFIAPDDGVLGGPLLVAAAVGVLVAAVAPAVLLHQSQDRPRLAAAARVVVHAVAVLLLCAVAADGLVALLSVTLPAPSSPALLAVPVALVWLGAAAGTEVALAAAPSGRLAVLLPAAPAWIYGMLLGPLTPWDRGLATLAVACVAVQLVRAVPPGGRHTGVRRNRRARAVVLVVAVGAVAAGLAPAVVGAAGPRHRVDPREALRAVPLPPAAANPMDWVDVWLTDPDRRLFVATSSDQTPYWRLAALTDFDGQQWLPPSRYARAGLGVPPAPGAAGTRGTVSQSVTVDRLAGPFLPAVDRPLRIDAPVSAVDTDSGVLVTDRADLRGLTYTVVSAAPAPTGDPTCGEAATAAVTAPPAELAALLAPIAGGRCSGPFASFARAVEQRLNTGRFNTGGAPSAGSSVGVLDGFLRPGGRGTVVEFAAGLTLALRAAGLPARLVVGFAPPPGTAGRPQEVYARHLSLWVDAWLPGAGWTAYHPTPPAVTDAAAVAPQPQPQDTPQETPSPLPSTSPVAVPPADDGDLRPVGRILIPAALAVAALAAGYVLAVLAVPWWHRRRRRRTGAPRERGLAAWHDVLDALAYAPAGHATPAQLRTATPESTERLLTSLCPATTGNQVAALTATASRCLFTPVPPAGDDIDAAWQAARVVRRRLYRRASLAGRVRRLLSPANLRTGPRWTDAPPREVSRAAAQWVSRAAARWRSRAGRRRG